MNLDPYLSNLPRGQASAFAAAIGISTVYLSQLRVRQGEREPSPKLCVDIERATNRDVMRWELRPKDWHEIWPELIGQEGAPTPETAKAD